MYWGYYIYGNNVAVYSGDGGFYLTEAQAWAAAVEALRVEQVKLARELRSVTDAREQAERGLERASLSPAAS